MSQTPSPKENRRTEAARVLHLIKSKLQVALNKEDLDSATFKAAFNIVEDTGLSALIWMLPPQAQASHLHTLHEAAVLMVLLWSTNPSSYYHLVRTVVKTKAEATLDTLEGLQQFNTIVDALAGTHMYRLDTMDPNPMLVWGSPSKITKSTALLNALTNRRSGLQPSRTYD